MHQGLRIPMISFITLLMPSFVAGAFVPFPFEWRLGSPQLPPVNQSLDIHVPTALKFNGTLTDDNMIEVTKEGYDNCDASTNGATFIQIWRRSVKWDGFQLDVPSHAVPDVFGDKHYYISTTGGPASPSVFGVSSEPGTGGVCLQGLKFILHVHIDDTSEGASLVPTSTTATPLPPVTTGEAPPETTGTTGTTGAEAAQTTGSEPELTSGAPVDLTSGDGQPLLTTGGTGAADSTGSLLITTDEGSSNISNQDGDMMFLLLLLLIVPAAIVAIVIVIVARRRSRRYQMHADENSMTTEMHPGPTTPV
eukprot:TRINITY_DN7557_c0_g2_i1.p1 TRINITY_DN7557_c0_g2~~TRINITY_DN7557_c0_g2_i1.p1  ORF type:complete len:307 (-),score=100.40 TRINITY_DN7557_c0_g2_i1:195-1115(-)